MKNKESNKSQKPKQQLRKIKHKGLSTKKKLLYPLETSTHLQSIINYTLPNGTQVGALLLNASDKVDFPEYKLRFIWECPGIHDDFGEVAARSIVKLKDIRKLNRSSIAILNENLRSFFLSLRPLRLCGSKKTGNCLARAIGMVPWKEQSMLVCCT
jgi:hypothetical protein